MIIIGAGLAGMLAQRYFGHGNIIFERNAVPTVNHQALLRFRTDRIGKLVGMPFNKVTVHKAITLRSAFVSPDPMICNLYSHKVTGEFLDRSIWDIDPSDRWVSPPDFYSRLLKISTVQYDHNWKLTDTKDATISTIPMPVLMARVGWKDIPVFKHRSIWACEGYIYEPSVNINQTVYHVDPELPYYRSSFMGNKFSIEFVSDPGDDEDLMELVQGALAAHAIDLPEVFYECGPAKEQKFGKIIPIDDELRKEFIYTMTREFNIYSLGRFACWKQILMDDVLDDLKVIERLMSAEGRRRNYHHNLELATE